ncbi:MAG TPA: family 78 glycoside hydrolase catalytic domain [Trebonia sp.]|jgi:hypothetical protein|nr:family 78 glycoside hydrolase catalytic domain [Trebonia sp.]
MRIPSGRRRPVLTVTRLRAEDLDSPAWLGTGTPVLRWTLDSDQPDAAQAAYRVSAATSPGLLEAGRPDLWDTGRVSGPGQRVRYAGTPLGSRRAVYWQVRAWAPGDAGPAVSAVHRCETCLLAESDWSARWITHPLWAGTADADAADPEGLPLLARRFGLAAPAASARLYVSGAGVYVASLNGVRIGDAVLEPPYGDFRQEVDYCAYDVTGLLRPGGNVLGLRLGTGIAHVTRLADRYTKFTGTQCRPRAIAQLESTAADGSVTRVVTDGSWRAALGPALRSHWYGGEDYDARRHDPAWDTSGGTLDTLSGIPDTSGGTPDDRLGWTSAVELDYAPRLVARLAPPVRVIEEIPAVSVSTPAPGVRVFDIGTNIAGWPRLRIGDPESDKEIAPGQEVRLLPGELLDDSGRVSQRATGWPIFDSYVTTSGPQDWHPEFTYHGFRYVEAHGLPDGATVSALALRAGNQPSGSFRCSDDLLNGIHRIIDRAVQGNMFSVLTDCPHREKLGWLEQDHLLFGVVSRGYDVAAYFRDLMRRIAAAQLPDGMVPTTAPEYVVFDGELGRFRDDPNWGGAIVLVPWQLYRVFGDDGVLAEYYPAMRRYADYLASQAEGNILGYGLGDWITTDDSTPVAVAATWGYWHVARGLAQVAGVLGEATEAAEYRGLAAAIAAAFHARFFRADEGTYGSGSQACDAFALDMDAVPDAARDRVARHLAGSVAAAGDHLTVGEIALPAIFRVLSAAGQDELLYRVATRTDSPSYGYQVTHGATALTEAWDGPAGRMSQNHFMLGAIDEWFFAGLAGLRQAPGSCGYREPLISPALVDGLDEVAASITTPYGRLACSWRRDPDGIKVDVSIPVGAVAEVRLPDLPGGAWFAADDPDPAPRPDRARGLRAGAGRHHYRFRR